MVFLALKVLLEVLLSYRLLKGRRLALGLVSSYLPSLLAYLGELVPTGTGVQ